MSINKQKSGKWLCQIDRKGLKRVRKSFATQKEAEIFEREFLDDNKKKLEANTDKRTLLELVKLWFQYHGHTLSDGSHMKSQLERLATEMSNPIASQVTPVEFLDYRFKKTVEATDNRQSAKTFNNIHGYLNAAYRKLYKLKIIDYACPTAEVDMLKVQERQLGYLSLDEIKEVMAACKNTSNPCVWWIAQICIRTGARWNEADKMTKKQLHNNSITFEFTKSKKTRTVALDEDFYKQLITFCADKGPNDRIFTNSYYTFADLMRKTDINFPTGQKSHILRHSYASHYIMNGGDVLTLQKILGHSDIKMTMRYAHLSKNHLKDAVSRGPMAHIDI